MAERGRISDLDQNVREFIGMEWREWGGVRDLDRLEPVHFHGRARLAGALGFRIIGFAAMGGAWVAKAAGGVIRVESLEVPNIL